MRGAALPRASAGFHTTRPASAWRETAHSLRARFESAQAPALPLDGEYRGRLVLLTVRGPLGALARAWASAWMSWRGKRFHADLGLGDNRFSNDARPWIRLFWPLYRQVHAADAGHFHAFTFAVRQAPSVLDPARIVMRIDYDLDENPRFWIRDVVDELVETGPGEYLGAAQVRHAGRWHTAAYFELQGSVPG